MLKLLLSLMFAALLPGTASAQEMGTAMIAYDEDDAPRLLVANQGAGSVTLLERKCGKRLNEVQLGGDLRQLARADDGTLLVTDYRGDRLLLLDDDLDLSIRPSSKHECHDLPLAAHQDRATTPGRPPSGVIRTGFRVILALRVSTP